MSLFINPTTKNFSLGDDNLWVWFQREFGAEFYTETLNKTDTLLNSSFHKLLNYDRHIITIHLELMKELRDKYSELSGYSENVDDMLYNFKHSNLTTIPSKLMYNDYKDLCKNLMVVPIGIDLNTFKPLPNKQELREKWKLPKNKRIGFWSGNTGIWRGVDDLKRFMSTNNVHWIINYYRGERLKLPGSKFFKIKQKEINELLSASDFYLCTNQLGPYYMSDWEAIAADIPIVDTVDIPREMGPAPSREKLIQAGWGRSSVYETWSHILHGNYI
jgi:hypothetical protein